MKSARGANLRAIPVEPNTEQTDSPPELTPTPQDEASINSGIDELDNLPSAPPLPVQVHPKDSNAQVGGSDDELENLPDASGHLGHVYKAVYSGDPDNVAKVLDTSDKLGADPAMVAGSLKDASKAANRPDDNFFQAIEDRYPGTTKFLQVPRNMAVSHDDMPNVAQHEDLFQKLKDAYAQGTDALKGGALQEELAFLRYQQMNGETTPNNEWFRVGGMVANTVGAPTNDVKARAEFIQGKLDEINKTKPQAGQDSWLKRGLYGAAEFGPQIVSGAMSGVKYAAPLAGSVAAAGAILGPADIPPTMAAAGAGFALGEADYNYKLMAGTAYDSLQKLRDTNGQPLPEQDVRIASMAMGAAGAGLSLVKLDALLGKAGQKFMQKFTESVPAAVLNNPETRSQALKAFAQNYVQSVAHGTAAMTAIAGVNILGERGVEAASGQTFDHSNEPGIGSQLATAAGDAALTFGVLGSAGAGVGLAHDLAQAKRTETNMNFYKALGETAEASKVRQRLPEAHRQLVEQLTKDGPVDSVFIPQEAFQSYFQSKNIDPETVANELGVQDSYRESVQTGGDVKVPLDVWASQVAGTEHYQGLAPDIKFNPEDLTSRQIEDRRAQIAEQIKQTEAEAQGEASPAAESAQKVYDERYQQLIDAGQTPHEARLSAGLHEAAFRNWGERTGIDPYELSQRLKLEIQKGESPEVAEGQAFNQSDAFKNEGYEVSVSEDPYFDDKGEEIDGPKMGDPGSTFSVNSQDKNGNDVGQARFYIDEHGDLRPDDRGENNAVQVDEAHRRKGLASEMYRQAEEATGKKVVHSSHQTEAGKLLAEDRKSYAQGERQGPAFNQDRPLQTSVPLPEEVKVTHHDGPAPSIKEAKDALKSLRDKSVKNEHTGWDIEMKRGGLDKSGTTLASEPNRLAAAHLDELLEKATYTRDEADKLGGDNDLNVLHAPLMDENGKAYTVKITLRDGPDGKKLYDKFTLENKDSATAFTGPDQTGGQEAADAAKARPQTLKINDFMHSVNELQRRDPFFQGEETPRGRITFQDSKAVIHLFKDADRSTFLHETGHYFLEIMNQLSAMENANPQIKEDMKAVRDWMGLKDGEEIGVPQHEQFARGFEAYLREGKAPSEVLRRTFQRFKQWLTQIYKSARGLNVELSPEIRGVMDRMLATDEEIKRAHQEVGFNQGLHDERVQTLAEKAREQAQSTLMAEQMKEISESNQKFIKDEQQRLTIEGEEKAANEPVFKAQNDIQEAIGKRKDILGLAKRILDDKVKTRPDMEAAVQFEMGAAVNGFEDGKDLANAMIEADNSKLRQKIIDDHVSQGMQEHGNLMDRHEIRNEALRAIHNDHMTELLALERQIFQDKVRGAEVSTEVSRRNRIEAKIQAAEAKAQAKEILDAKPIREAGNFRTYTTAERNAAVKADAALKREDYARATEYKRQQMLNHALAAEAMRNRDEAEAAVKTLKKAANRDGDLKKMPYAYNRQVDQLLEKFGLKDSDPEDQKTLTQIAKDMQAKGETPEDIANATGMIIDPQTGQFRSESLRDFVNRLNENFFGLRLPENIMSGAGVDDYRDMQMGDLRDLKATVKTLTKLGKLHDRFLNDFIKIDMKEAAKRLKDSLEEKVGTPYGDIRKLGDKYDSEWKTRVMNLKNIPDGMISTLVNTLTLCTYLDGGDKNGPAHDYIYRPLKQAEDRKFARYAKMREEIAGENGLFSKFYDKKELADYKNKVTEYDGRSISKEQILSMALNWGNEQNRDRIRMGFGSRDGSGRLVPLSDDTINGFFKHLDKKDWDFAQAAWDHLETYWPEISALEMKVRGVEPERVVHAPFDNEHGSYRGGYYPIAYDFDKSTEAFKNEQQKTELYKSYSAASAMTESGHTISRVSYVARPVRLSLDVFFNHLENVIHDLEFRPTIIDTTKFLNMPDVKNSLINSIGQDGYRGVESWLKGIATDQSENLTWYEKALTWSRFGTTISALGLTPKAFLLHAPSNVFNAMWETGVQNTVRFMTRAALDVAMGRGELKDFVFDKSERMKQRLTVRDRDIMDMAKAWQGTAAGFIPHYAFMSLHLADEAVSVPLWADTYKKNVAEFGEQKAIDIADETVTRALGSGSKVDQIGAQRGSQAKKLFTMFYSWESVMFNRAWLDGKIAGLEYRKENVGKAAAILAKATFFAWALPAVHEALLKQAMTNSPNASGVIPSTDEEKKKFIANVAEAPFAMIPFVRDIVPPALHRALGEHGGDFRLSPVEQSWQNLYTPLSDGARIAFTDKQMDEHYAEEVARGMAQASGYPQQLNTWAFNLLDYVQDNGEASMKDFLSRRRKK